MPSRYAFLPAYNSRGLQAAACAWSSDCPDCGLKCVPNPNWDAPVIEGVPAAVGDSLGEEPTPEETALYVCYAIGIVANNPTVAVGGARRRSLLQAINLAAKQTAAGAPADWAGVERHLLQSLSDLSCPADLSAFDADFVRDVSGGDDTLFTTIPQMKAYMDQYCGTVSIRRDSDVTSLIYLNTIASSKAVPTDNIDVRIGTDICTQPELFKTTADAFERKAESVFVRAEYESAFEAAMDNVCMPALSKPDIAPIAACLGSDRQDAVYYDRECTRALVQAYDLDASIGDKWTDAYLEYNRICSSRTTEQACEDTARNGELDGVVRELSEVDNDRGNAYSVGGASEDDSAATGGISMPALLAGAAMLAAFVL